MRSSPFIRQMYVAVPPLLAALSAGGTVGYPMVLLQQLKAKDSPIQLDFETSSWMGSINGIASIPSIVIPSLMQWKGRKLVFMICCVILITGWVVAYFAADAATLLLAESLHGLATGSLLTISCLTITELMSPRYRDGCMQLFYIMQTIGLVVEAAISQYYDWRIISIIMLVPMVISVILTFTIPESPYWLAYKGFYSKCESNFIWLRGTDPLAKKELNDLTNKPIENMHSFGIKSVRHFWETILSRDFLMPAVHAMILQFVIYGSGTMVTLIYIISMLEKVTGNHPASAYGGFIINSMLCIGLSVGIVTARYFDKKTTLLCSIFSSAFFMGMTSMLSYLQTIGMWPQESLIGLFCLSGFMLTSGAGIMGLAQTVAASLIAVKNRGLGGALMVINTGVFHSGSLKFAPYMFLHLNMWGSLLVYTAVSITCGLLIWRCIPEIKDRTLQEIENYYKYGSFSRNNRAYFESSNILPKD